MRLNSNVVRPFLASLGHVAQQSANPLEKRAESDAPELDIELLAVVQNWVARKLQEGGFLEGGGENASATTSTAAAPAAAAAAPDLTDVVEARTVEEQQSTLADSGSPDQNIGIAAESSGGLTPHYNPVTGKTMWMSPDGRSSYVTIDDTAISTKLRP